VVTAEFTRNRYRRHCPSCARYTEVHEQEDVAAWKAVAEELEARCEAMLDGFDETRPHQGRWCFGKTPMQTFLDALPMTKEKMIAA
jgi:hypothetical protein